MNAGSKLEQLYKLITSKKDKLPTNLRIFFIEKNELVRVFNGRYNFSWQADEFGTIRNLNLKRGEILDLFGKLEFFIDELILIKIVGLDFENKCLIGDILEYVDFFNRVSLLRKWGIIDNSLFDSFIQVKQVRNGLAHAWDENEIDFRGSPLRINFNNFKTEMEKVWERMIDVYNIEFKKINIDKLINQIEVL